jgi:hypothetical protein
MAYGDRAAKRTNPFTKLYRTLRSARIWLAGGVRVRVEPPRRPNPGSLGQGQDITPADPQTTSTSDAMMTLDAQHPDMTAHLAILEAVVNKPTDEAPVGVLTDEELTARLNVLDNAVAVVLASLIDQKQRVENERSLDEIKTLLDTVYYDAVCMSLRSQPASVQDVGRAFAKALMEKTYRLVAAAAQTEPEASPDTRDDGDPVAGASV